MTQALKLPSDHPPFMIRDLTDVKEIDNWAKELDRTLRQLRSDIVEKVNQHADFLNPTEGTAPPTTTPTAKGLLFLDTTTKTMYISVGTAGPADWKQITP